MDKLENSLTLLCDLNSRLLEALKQNNQKLYPDLLEMRTTLSDEIQALCGGEDIKLKETNEQILTKAQLIMSQDAELVIYLERLIQKIRGNYSRLIMDAQNKLRQSGVSKG